MCTRFPFSFSQPSPIPRPTNDTSRTTFFSTAVAFSVAAGATALAATSDKTKDALINILSPSSSSSSSSSSLPWCSLSLGEGTMVEPRSGASFPEVIRDTQKLLGVGLRRKSVLGLKKIDVYAFGVYANDDDLKKLLGEKNGKLSNEDVLEADVCTTVRLQILYTKLSIGSVRSAFEESVGNRLQKFGGAKNKDLLQRFASQFKDEYKVPRGAVIELSRERGHILCTKIDGKEVGSVHSKLLCKSILDLYVGEDPFDKQAKEDIESKLASLDEK